MRTRLAHAAGIAALIALAAACNDRGDGSTESRPAPHGSAAPTSGGPSASTVRLDPGTQHAAEATGTGGLKDGEYPVHITRFSGGAGSPGSITVDVIQFCGTPDLPTDVGNDEPNFEKYATVDGRTYWVRNQNPRLRTLRTTSDISIFQVEWTGYHEFGDSQVIPTGQFDATWWQTESGGQRPWIMTIRDGVVGQLVNAT